MKRIAAFIILAVIIILVPSLRTNAHVLLADQDVGAIVHVEPNDNPVSGRQAQVSFYFEDVTNRFSLDRCNCEVDVIRGDEVISSDTLYAITTLESRNNYTFSEPGDYTLRVSGTPRAGADFQEFSLDYGFRVVPDGIQAQSVTPVLMAGFAGLMGLIMLAAFVSDSSPKE